MSYLLSWSDWLSLKESNARKRAVTAAMNGTGPSLPGSYAACPSTNPYAMDIAFKTGVVGKRKKKKRKNLKLESNEKKPDYSFDSWLKKVDDLEKQLKDLYDNGEKSEEDLDKKKKDKNDKSLENKDLEDNKKDKNDKSLENKDLEDNKKDKNDKSLENKDLEDNKKDKNDKSLENKDLDKNKKEDEKTKGNKWNQFAKMKKVSEEKPSSKDLKKSQEKL